MQNEVEADDPDAIFEDKCSLCHEEDGNSEDIELNLVDEEWRHGGEIDDIIRTIRDGVPDTKMKSFAEKLSPEEIEAVAYYVKALNTFSETDMASDMETSISSGKPVAKTSRSLDSTWGEVLSLRLLPESPTLWGADAMQHFTVIGKFADGLERDLTCNATLTSADSSIATVDTDGCLQAIANGEVEVTAETADMTASVHVRIEETHVRPPFNFQREIGGILTEQGCNAASCHGGVKGRGGFKLAINAIHPAEDYQWIVKGGSYQVLVDEPLGEEIPRINIENPEQSLLLLKPTLSDDHEGGKVFSKDSEPYRRLIEWIHNRAPYDEQGAETVRIERLELLPREFVLQPNGQCQLLVTAHLSNGKTEDITDDVHFETTNKEIIRVDKNGLVTGIAKGETEVIVRAPGVDATARFGVIENLIDDFPDMPAKNLIDKHIFAKLHKFHILPSDLSTDEEFLRRVCFDVAGRLPPPRQTWRFLENPDPNKREKLIDILLESPEYIEYWTFRFSDLYRVGLGYRSLSTAAYWEWLYQSIAQNKPYDQIARERLAATGYDGPSRHYSLYAKITPIPLIVAEELRVFMGRRLDCAQCHNHPFESWSQDQFWGTAAFFAGLYCTDWSEGITSVLFDDPDWKIDHPLFVESAMIKHPRSDEPVKPTFLNGLMLSEEQRDDPRRALAEWITSHPYFAEAIVNRMWSYFFGRGIVEPVDDFRSTNTPTHPELLRTLAEDFTEQGYDLKRLIRMIVNSRTYQLSHVPNESNRDDKINYSHTLPRALDAEILLDAISDVTGVPEVFLGEEGKTKAPQGTRAVQLKAPLWQSRFLEIYGRTQRQSIPERGNKPNLAQALHVWVGETYTDKLGREGGRLNKALASEMSDHEIIEEFYLSAFTRFPQDKEKSKLEAMIAAQPSRTEAFESLLWAILSSREFMYKP